VMLDALYQNRQWIVPSLGFTPSVGAANLNEYLTGIKSTGGLYVRKVVPGELFAQAGVKEGDLLLAIDGVKISRYGKMFVKAIEDKVNLHGFMARKKVGSIMKIHVYRRGLAKGTRSSQKGKLLKLQVMYNQTPRPVVRTVYEPIVDQPKFQIVGGIVFTELTQNIVKAFLDENPNELVKYMDKTKRASEPALIISNVIPGSMAAKDGSLKAGMLVKEVNGRKVVNMSTLCSALSSKSNWWSVKTRKTFTVLNAKAVYEDLRKRKEGLMSEGGRASHACAIGPEKTVHPSAKP